MGVDTFGAELGKLKRLHDDDTRPQLGKGGEPITWLEIYPQDSEIENVNILIGSATVVGSYLIWSHSGSPLYGLWDTGSWASQTTEWEEPEFNPLKRFNELKIHQFFLEDFTATTYRDAGNTEAEWSTEGSLLFMDGSTTAQSIKVLGSDIQVGSLNRVILNVYGSNIEDLVGSLTTNGANWLVVDIGLEKEFTTNLGSDVRWRLEYNDSGGSVEVGSVSIEVKSDDY